MVIIGELGLLYPLGLLSTLLIYVIFKLYSRSPRVPLNVPILRISELKGKLGDAADIESFEKDGSQVVQQGYDQYSKKSQNFLMRTSEGLVFVAAPAFIEEIRTAPTSVLSAMAVNNETLQVKYTLHSTLHHDWYEFGIIRRQFTHNLGSILPYIVDECHDAFTKEIGNPKDWTAMPMWPIASRVVTRTANRIIYGKELAANDEFLQLSIDYTYTVFGGAHQIRPYPRFLRPLVLRLKTGIAHQNALARKHLAPLFVQRIDSMQRVSKTEDQATKPDDGVQWLLDITPPEKLNIDMLIYRILHISVSANHTSSSTYLDAVYDLAIHPEIQDVLREEIVSVMGREGHWTKQELTKMVKLDSFLKESARWHPFLAGSLERMALKDYGLSDGSTITQGTKVTVPHYAMYFDEQLYGPTAHEFDAFRFSKMRSQPGQEQKHSFVECTPKHTHFGYGKTACPGRFFVTAEMKVLLAYTLCMYDIRWPKDQGKPASTWTGSFRSTDMSLKVEWKLRKKPLLHLDQIVSH